MCTHHGENYGLEQHSKPVPQSRLCQPKKEKSRFARNEPMHHGVLGNLCCAFNRLENIQTSMLERRAATRSVHLRKRLLRLILRKTLGHNRAVDVNQDIGVVVGYNDTPTSSVIGYLVTYGISEHSTGILKGLHSFSTFLAATFCSSCGPTIILFIGKGPPSLSNRST